MPLNEVKFLMAQRLKLLTLRQGGGQRGRGGEVSRSEGVGKGVGGGSSLIGREPQIGPLVNLARRS